METPKHEQKYTTSVLNNLVTVSKSFLLQIYLNQAIGKMHEKMLITEPHVLRVIDNSKFPI